MSNIITKEDLQKLAQFKPTEIETSIGKLKIIPLTYKVRNEARILASQESAEVDLAKFHSYIIINCVVEPKLTIADLDWVENLPSGIIDEIITKIYEISNITLDLELLKKK